MDAQRKSKQKFSPRMLFMCIGYGCYTISTPFPLANSPFCAVLLLCLVDWLYLTLIHACMVDCKLCTLAMRAATESASNQKCEYQNRFRLCQAGMTLKVTFKRATFYHFLTKMLIGRKGVLSLN